MVSWISTPTAEGTLYDVDLRLRPEGQASAIAISIDRLSAYFDQDAWIWEKQALTKARPVAGDAGPVCLQGLAATGTAVHGRLATPQLRRLLPR